MKWMLSDPLSPKPGSDGRAPLSNESGAQETVPGQTLKAKGACRMAKMTTVLTLSYLLFCTWSLMGSSLRTADWGKENSGRICSLFCVLCKLHSGVDSCHTTVPFWDISERQVVKDHLSVGRASNSTPDLFILTGR